MEVSIITGANHFFIKELYILLYSYKKLGFEFPLYLYDLGLTDNDISQIKKTGVDLEIIDASHIREGIGSSLKKGSTSDYESCGERGKYRKNQYIKPFLLRDIIEKTGFHAVWIDVDTLLISDKIFNMFLKIGLCQSVFTETGFPFEDPQYAYLKNIIEEYPLKYTHNGYFDINSGVIFLNKKDKDTILKTWIEKTLKVLSNDGLQIALPAEDQGCLVWALSDYPETDFCIVGDSFNLHPEGLWGEARSNKSFYKDIGHLWSRTRNIFRFRASLIHAYGRSKFSHIIESSEEDMVEEIIQLPKKHKKILT